MNARLLSIVRSALLITSPLCIKTDVLLAMNTTSPAHIYPVQQPVLTQQMLAAYGRFLKRGELFDEIKAETAPTDLFAPHVEDSFTQRLDIHTKKALFALSFLNYKEANFVKRLCFLANQGYTACVSIDSREARVISVLPKVIYDLLIDRIIFTQKL
jgi:hypothetical protein